MRTIHKYPLSIIDEQTVMMPEGAWILDVQMQRGEPCLWALVDTECPMIAREIVIAGTGQLLETRTGLGAYIATFQAGSFVGHVFHGNNQYDV